MTDDNKFVGDSDLTPKQVRTRLHLTLRVQRGLLHDKDTPDRHEALAQCAVELTYLSSLLTHMSHENYDDDVELGLRLAAHEAERYDEQNESFALWQERDLYLDVIHCEENRPSNDDLRMPRNIRKLSDDLLPGDDMMLPDLTTIDTPNLDANDDLFDGWIWDEESQGFVNQGSWDDQDEDDEPSYKEDDHKDGKNRDDHKKKN